MTIDPDFWNGKKVLLTGHSGFKGSWLVIVLRLLGAQIFGYSLQPHSTPSLFDLCKLEKYCTNNFSDIRDKEELVSYCKNHKPDILIHLAAQSLVIDSYINPHNTYTTNVIGTLNVLEAVQAASIEQCLIITTDKVYENREWIYPYRETDPLGGHDIYSSSKACTELLASSYTRSIIGDGIKVHTVRAGNVIGGGDFSSNRLIPDLVRAAANKSSLKVRNPNSTRPWQHVLEPISAYLELIQKMEGLNDFDTWNVGPSIGDVETVKNLIIEFRKHISTVKVDYEMPKFHEASLLALDTSKIQGALGWKPRLSIRQSVIETANWYNRYLNNSELSNYTFDRAQSFLDSYMK